MQNSVLYETQTINRTYNCEQIKISRPEDIYQLKQLEEIKNKLQEHLVVISLNNKNMIDSIELVGIGSSNCITISATDVLRCAIVRGSKGVIVAHNHPTGDNIPSKIDIEFTNRLNNLAKAFDLALFDHIIVGNTNLSMRESGYIYEDKYEPSFFENETIKELKEQNSKLLNRLEKLKNKNRNVESKILQGEELEV